MNKAIIKMTQSIRKLPVRCENFEYVPRYYDVGVNITDKMFEGNYRGKAHHKEDISEVLHRAKALNVEKLLLTGSSLHESRVTIDIAKRFNDLNEQNENKIYPHLSSTVGVHPCSVMEFLDKKTTEEKHLDQLREVVKYGIESKVVKAFGEIGLDYDRLFHTPKKEQLHFFEMQLKLACEFDLPLFLHMRSAFQDFVDILMPFLNGTRDDKLELKNKKVLVHSFTGTKEELEYFVSQPNIYISVNGCSLRYEENVEVAKSIPLERLLIETDSPWCEIKRTHASYKYLTKSPNVFYPILYNPPASQPGIKKEKQVNFNEFLPFPVVKSEKLDSHSNEMMLSPLVKSRNEPCLVGLCGEIMSKLLSVEPEELIEACYFNSEKLFS